MYYTPDPNEGKRNNIILVLLIIVAVFVLVISVPAQERIVINKDGAREISMINPISFGDTLKVGFTIVLFESDSIHAYATVEINKQYFKEDYELAIVFSNGNCAFSKYPERFGSEVLFYKLSQEGINRLYSFDVSGFVLENKNKWFSKKLPAPTKDFRNCFDVAVALSKE